jgi:hypothetical protein
LISYTDSKFSNVKIVDKPWLEDCVIDTVGLGLAEAIDLMRAANYDAAFAAVTLREPLYPGVDEPSYIFGCPELGHVFVGVNSKKVTLEPFEGAPSKE